MAYINSKRAKLLDIKLSSRNYYDLTLSDYTRICGCDNILSPIVCVHLSGTSVNYGDVAWVDGVSLDGEIENFGITGYDNRRVPTLSSGLDLDGDLRLILKPVSGDTFDYDILSGETVQLCGGFFQGFYKLEGMDYQVLPDFFKDGWTLEFYLSSGGTCSGNTLNDVYPNNEGIFYYYGTRADNKFCSLKEHLLAYMVSSGVTFLEESIPFTSHIIPPEGESSFLFFNCSGLTDFYANATGVTFEFPDCCDGLKHNALAFRLKPDGKLGYRYLGSSGVCVDGKFSEDFQVFEEYTNQPVISDENFHLVTITFKNYEHHTCKPNKPSFGKLSMYVDGFLKMRVENFPNIIPYAFDDLPSKQMGVPYNISIGGGTQGLLEMQQDPPVTYNVCDYSFYLAQEQVMYGIEYNGVEYYTPTKYGYNDEEAILNFLKSIISESILDFNYTKDDFYLEFTLRFAQGDFSKVFYDLAIDTGSVGSCCSPNLPTYSQSSPYKHNCFSFTTDNNTCGILEENFAGSFIGKIKTFCLYDKPLDLETIRCNNQIYTT